MVAAAVEEMNLWHAGVVFTCAHFRAGVVMEGNSDAFETAKHDFIQHVKNAQCDVAQVIATHCPPGSSWDSAPGWAKQRPADHRFWCAVEEEYNSPASMHMRNEEIPAFKEMLESVRNYMVQKFAEGHPARYVLASAGEELRCDDSSEPHGRHDAQHGCGHNAKPDAHARAEGCA